MIALASIIRNLPLFFFRRPRTPLRVLCIVAFDAVARMRSRWLSPRTKRAMIAAVDLGACLNDFFDEGTLCRDEYRQTRRLLAGTLSEHGRCLVRAYYRQLHRRETARPALSDEPQGAKWRASVVRYGENIVRLSLATLAAVAFGGPLPAAERNAVRDKDLAVLFRIVMLAQILDDLMDWSEDLRMRLPTFMTLHRLGSAGRGHIRRVLRQVRTLADSYTRGFELAADRLLLQRIALRAVRWMIDGAALWRTVFTPSIRQMAGHSEVLDVAQSAASVRAFRSNTRLRL